MPLADRVLEPTTLETLAGHDVVFLALPHGQSGELAAQLGDDVVVIDCGADFRLTDPAAWEQFYGGDARRLLALRPARAARASASCSPGPRRIAVPGCYPTVSTLALAPAVAAGLVEPDVVVVAASGTSGAGKAAKPHLLGSEVMGNASAVRRRRRPPAHPRDRAEPLRPHRRTASRSASRRSWSRCRAASSPPARRRWRPTASTADEAYDVYAKAYADEPFVHLLPPGQWPQTKSVHRLQRASTSRSTVDEAAGRLVAVGAVDNLAKGTGGAAVQCMNLALGLDETLGLTTVGHRAVSVTAPQRLPGRRRRRRPQGRAARRTSPSSSTTAPRYDSASVFTANRCKAEPGAVEPGGRQGRHRPRRRPQLRRRQLLHRAGRLPDHPRRRRAGRRPARHRRRRRRGLLDRADRPGQRPADTLLAGVDAAHGALDGRRAATTPPPRS